MSIAFEIAIIILRDPGVDGISKLSRRKSISYKFRWLSLRNSVSTKRKIFTTPLDLQNKEIEVKPWDDLVVMETLSQSVKAYATLTRFSQGIMHLPPSLGGPNYDLALIFDLEFPMEKISRCLDQPLRKLFSCK